MPEHTVAGGLAGGAGSHHIADKGDLVTFLTELGDCFQAAGEAGFSHGQCMQGDIRAAPCVACRGEVIRVDFAFNLENFNGNFFREFGLGFKPFSIRPGLQNFFSGSIVLGKSSHIINGIIHQSHFGQGSSRGISQLGIFKGIDKILNIVAAHHGAENFNGINFGDQRG